MGFLKKANDFIARPTRIRTILVVFILLIAIPFTVFVAQQRQETRQRAEGPQVNITQNLSQNNNPQGCGDNCEEDPPLLPGTVTINYCSKPLTVPNRDLSEEYKSYANVQKNGKDNRYFVFVSKDNEEPVEIAVDNLSDVVVEQLAGKPVSFDGNDLTVLGSGAFVLHGNPGRTSFLGVCLGLFCSEKDLNLKTKEQKQRVYPNDNCAELSNSMAYTLSQFSLDKDRGLGKGLLYGALYKALETVMDTEAHVISNAKLETPLADIELIDVKIDVEIGGDPGVPLRVGDEYGKLGGQAAIYTEGGEVQSALKFARGLRREGNMSDTDKLSTITEIDKWISANGVYANGKVIEELKLVDPDLADFAIKWGQENIELSQTSTRGHFAPGEETLTNIMAHDLPGPNKRFLCVCRDIALLGTAMAREAGIDAWLATGQLVGVGDHAWVQFGYNNRVGTWDPTIALPKGLNDLPPKPLTSVLVPESSQGSLLYRQLIPFPLLNGENENPSSLKDDKGNIIQYTSSRKPGEPDRIFIDNNVNRTTRKLTYTIQNAVDNSRIPVIKMYYAESLGGSFGFSASTTSKVPIIVDTGKGLMPLNENLFPPKSLSAIKTYNEALSNFLRDPPNNLPELMQRQQESLARLRKEIDDLLTTIGPEDRIAMGKVLDEVNERANSIKSEKVASAVTDTLATAENSSLKNSVLPLKDTTLISQKIKANPKYQVYSKGIGMGGGIVATFFGAPALSDYAETIDNAYLMATAKAVNVVGMGSMVLPGGRTLLQSAGAVRTAYRAARGAFAARAAAGTIAGGAALGGATVGLIPEAVIGGLATAMGTTMYCGANPKSTLCGCHISGEYGNDKVVLELQKYDVSKGEKVKYRVLGFENCPTRVGLEAAFGMVNLASAPAPEPKITTGKDGNSRNPIGGKGTECKWQPDGRWCLGEFTANLDKGSYKLTILQPQIVPNSDNPLYLYPHETNQVLNVDGGGDLLVKLILSPTSVPQLTPSSNPKPSLSLSPTVSPSKIPTPTPTSTPKQAQCYDSCMQRKGNSSAFCNQTCGLVQVPISLKTTPAPTISSVSVTPSISTRIPTPTVTPTSILKPTLKPVLKLSSSPTPTLLQYCYQSCSAKPEDDRDACYDYCDQKYTVVPTIVTTITPIPTPIITSAPQISSCPVSLTKADANCDGKVDMTDYSKQRDYALSSQITEDQLTNWLNSVWIPIFASGQ